MDNGAVRRAIIVVFAVLLLFPISTAIDVKVFLNFDGSAYVDYSGLNEPAKYVSSDASAISMTNRSVSFETQEFTRKEGAMWHFVFVPQEDCNLTIRFPAGARVAKGDGQVHTEYGLIYLARPCTKDEAVDIAYSYYPEEGISPFVLLGAGAVILAGTYYIYSKQRARTAISAGKQPPAREAQVPTPAGTSARKSLELLPDTERKVVEFLLAHGAVTQKDAEAGVNMPKSTVSRTMKSLEAKGVIERKKVGLSKKIFLAGGFIREMKMGG
ncbi:MAG: MarR family transcriptional regulator [Candidatus Micrarchaeota archaeon]